MLRILCGLILALLPISVRAESVADFYKNKSITLIVGYGPGGGYDVYARLLARYLGRYVPGSPAVVIQNMPGAGSLRAANYIYNNAPKDGSVIGTFSRDMPLAGVLAGNSNIQFDPRKFTWLGSPSSFATDAYVLWVRKDAEAKSIEEARGPKARTLIIGGTGEGASGNDVAILLQDVLKIKFKIITGYPDSGALFLAIERKELDGRFAGISAVGSSKAEWLDPKSNIHALLQFGRPTRHPNYPNVPTARELATDEQSRLLIEFAELPYLLSRPFVAPPNVPADRAAALQKAFLDATADKEFLVESERLKVEVSPVGATEALSLLDKVVAAPESVKETMRKLAVHE